MKSCKYLKPSYLFILQWIFFISCYKTSPDRSNPLDPASSTRGDPFQMSAKPFYGEVHLSWLRPSNIEKPTFNIYRQHPDYTKFMLLDTTSNENYYDDDSTFVYDKDYVYQVSAFYQNDESQPSQPIKERPYRFPKTRGSTTGTGGFIRGIQSKIYPAWMYILDNEFQTIQVFDVSSNEFSECNSSLVKGQIRDYTLAVVNQIEYILSISSPDNYLNLSKVENNNISNPADQIVPLVNEAMAITSASINDSLVFVALRVSSDSIEILKINYLTRKIIQNTSFFGKPISFMLFREETGRLFLLSEASNKVFMLDKNLNQLGSANVGNTSKNIAASPDSTLLFVCCEDNAEIYSLKVDGNSLKSYQLRKSKNADATFIWVDCSIGEEYDILFYYLVYNQRSFSYQVDVWRTFNGINEATFVNTLYLEPKFWSYHEIVSIAYIHQIDENRFLRNLYLFSRNKIRCFKP